MDNKRVWPKEFRVITLVEIDSTNAEAIRRMRSGEGDGLVVLAETQMAGRGRRGRNWESPRGNLHMSVIVGGVSNGRAGETAYLAALAVGTAIRNLVPDGKTVGYKWPNDILVNGRKVAGILIESDGDPSRLVVGIGVNLRHMPKNYEFPASSLDAEGVLPIQTEVLAIDIAVALNDWRTRMQTGGFEEVRREWLEHAVGIGSEISARLPTTILSGVFVGIDETGALRLRAANGELSTIAAADVFLSPS